jgi:dCMP deaminase
MKIAQVLADTSSGVRLKVGAVLVRDNNILSTGYNALPSAIDGPLEDKQYMINTAAPWLDVNYIESEYPFQDVTGRYKLVTKPEVRHAEKSVLMNLCKTNESAVGASLFVTASCCKYCAIDIVDAGIKEVFYKEEYRDVSGLEYLRANNVKVTKI